MKKREKVAQLAKAEMRRVLGVTDLFAIGYGDLGSSIYYALGITAMYALGATPLALMAAGLVFICTALTYAQLSSAFHEAGGSASFSRHVFNDLISFIAGWGLLLDYIVTIAISAFAIGPYLAYFFPELKAVDVQIGFTLGIISILFIMNFFGVKQSTRISFFLVGITLVTQLVVIAIGMGWLFKPLLIWEHLSINVAAPWSPTWPEFFKGLAMAMVAYTGIESIAQLGAEAKQPEKKLPRAILITMGVLIAMYLGLSLVALSAISPHDLGSKYLNDPIAGIVQQLPFASAILVKWIGLLAAIILFVAANAGVVGASRLAFNLGEYYQLPHFVYRLHARFRTPYLALFIFCLFASIVVALSRGRLDFLADLYNFGAQIAFFSAHLALIVFCCKHPHFKFPFSLRFLKIPGTVIPLTAVLGLIASLGVWILIVITKPEGRYLGLIWMVFGLVMYYTYRHRKKITATGSVKIEKIKIPEFKLVKIHNIVITTQEKGNIEALRTTFELAKLHHAQVRAIYVIEVPYSLPLDAKLSHRETVAELLLKRAEALGHEYGISVELKTLRARSFTRAVLDFLKENPSDLLVLEAFKSENEAIAKQADCRVLLCT